jgi:tetratricopeptide (TPR) repeat protein
MIRSLDMIRVQDVIPREWPSRRTLTAGGAAVLALVIIAGAVWYWQSSQQQHAAAAYAAAQAQATAARGPQAAPDARATAARGLETALQTYPSASAAAQAAYELANLRYMDRQYGAARSAYDVAAAKASSGTLRTVSRLGVGYTWEAEKDFPKAIDAFQSVLSRLKPADAFYEETLFDLARTQELAGRKDDAVQTYRRLLKEVPKTRRADEVRARLASFGVTP